MGVDAAGRGLDLLDPLPQVGTVVASDDYDRVTRLLSDLADLVDERNELFGEHRAVPSRSTAATPGSRCNACWS